MNKFYVCTTLLLTLLFSHASAEEKRFLTVDDLIESDYILLTGQQLLEILSDRTIVVIDIETDAVTISDKSNSNEAMDRKFVETKSDKTSALLDARLMARAPPLKGKIERKIVGDELVSTDGIRTYHYKLYKKQGRIFATRDIDHGDVFFEVKLK